MLERLVANFLAQCRMMPHFELQQQIHFGRYVRIMSSSQSLTDEYLKFSLKTRMRT